MDLLDTEQYLQMKMRPFFNDGIEPDENNAFDLKVWDTTRYTEYWQE